MPTLTKTWPAFQFKNQLSDNIVEDMKTTMATMTPAIKSKHPGYARAAAYRTYINSMLSLYRDHLQDNEWNRSCLKLFARAVVEVGETYRPIGPSVPHDHGAHFDPHGNRYFQSVPQFQQTQFQPQFEPYQPLRDPFQYTFQNQQPPFRPPYIVPGVNCYSPPQAVYGFGSVVVHWILNLHIPSCLEVPRQYTVIAEEFGELKLAGLKSLVEKSFADLRVTRDYRIQYQNPTGTGMLPITKDDNYRSAVEAMVTSERFDLRDGFHFHVVVDEDESSKKIIIDKRPFTRKRPQDPSSSSGPSKKTRV
ncbi:hypothetical protein E4T43_03331 [Aureobasidium subglaciale]|nr:hypothetical protein E4T43_03331 [Aureobasidium subglaciale]